MDNDDGLVRFTKRRPINDVSIWRHIFPPIRPVSFHVSAIAVKLLASKHSSAGSRHMGRKGKPGSFGPG